jgi:Flp pilus assembly protein TadD
MVKSSASAPGKFDWRKPHEIASLRSSGNHPLPRNIEIPALTPVSPAPQVPQRFSSPWTSPDRAGREEALNAAMRGLRYDDARIEIDSPVAAEIVPSPSSDQAAIEQAAGQIALGERRFIDAVANYTRGVLNAPDNSEALEGLGWSLHGAGRSKEACVAARSAYELNPTVTRLPEALALFAQSAGDFTQSVDAWRAVLSLDPNHATARGRLAILHYFSEDHAAAWAQLHAAEAAGQSVPPQLRGLLAEQMPEPDR